jgi:putative ABC transport system permease protein
VLNGGTNRERAIMNTIMGDIRYAVRRILRSPGFSAMVVLTLALGMGANTAIFSVVNAVLLRPLPYEDPDRLVTIYHHYPSLDLDAPVSAGGFRDYRDKTRSFAGVAVESGWGANLTGYGEPIRITGSRVSAQFFSVLGVNAVTGRTFTPEEDVRGNHFVVVLSDALWKRQFGGDPAVMNRTISLNGEPYTVIGIMPPGFRDFFNRTADLWVPLALSEQEFAAGRTNEYLPVTARLGPGVSVEQASAEMSRFAEQLKQETPDQYPENWTLTVQTFNERATGDIRPALLVLLGAVGLVLLIACANVANLLLARAAGRLKEVAVRMALGAKRWQLVRQLLAESTMLALAGGVLGVAFAWAGMRALTAALDVPALLGENVSVDGWVLTFTGVLSVLTGVLFGLAPALQSTKTDVQDTLREGGRGAAADRSGHALRRIFVVAEFGLALSLLAGAGLLIKSFARLQAVDPGFNPENLLTANLALPAAKYPNDTVRIAFFDQAIAQIAALPGVRGVAATSTLPFGGGWSTGSFSVEGYTVPEGQPSPWGDQRRVNPGFASAMGLPVLQGRFLSEQDGPGTAPVAVVDEELVKRYFANRDPIGQHIIFGNPESPNALRIQIVGVVGHSAHEGLDAERRVQVYTSYRQRAVSFMALAIRTQGDPLAMVQAVRQAILAVDPEQPIANIATMESLIDRSVGQRRLAMLLLGVFAAIGLLLAATGIYGVMSYSVTQRAQEMGVRMALGAGRRDVLAMVMKQGMALAGIGTLIGVASAWALTRALQTQLFNVDATDPPTFIAVTLLLVLIGLIATLVPALRATRLDPVSALRQE